VEDIVESVPFFREQARIQVEGSAKVADQMSLVD
jgi:hypothetical protein